MIHLFEILSMLVKNLKYLREKNKLTQQAVAELLGISRSTYANYEKEQSEPTASQLLILATHYQVGVGDFLTKDIGAPLFRQQAVKADHILAEEIRVLPITVSDSQKTNIEFVPAKAIAGYVSGMKERSYISELPRFYLPKLPEGTYRAFEIEGHSMPPINDGAIVVGRYIEHARDLKSGHRYVLVLRNKGVVFKKIVDELQSNQQLLLTSDNPAFLPYSTPAKDVLEAWEFVAYIGFHNKTDMNYILLDKINDLQQQLGLLTSKIA